MKIGKLFNKENFYELFLEKLFDNQDLNVNVQCLNGKTTIKSKFDNLKLENKEIFEKIVFIVDSDFDQFLKKDIYNYKNFIYLNKYISST